MNVWVCECVSSLAFEKVSRTLAVVLRYLPKWWMSKSESLSVVICLWRERVENPNALLSHCFVPRVTNIHPHTHMHTCAYTNTHKPTHTCTHKHTGSHAETLCGATRPQSSNVALQLHNNILIVCVTTLCVPIAFVLAHSITNSHTHFTPSLLTHTLTHSLTYTKHKICVGFSSFFPGMYKLMPVVGDRFM